MTKPLIGMSGRRWPASALANNVPKAMYELKFDLHFSDYPASVAAAGGLPVELTRDADVAGVLARLDGARRVPAREPRAGVPSLAIATGVLNFPRVTDSEVSLDCIADRDGRP